MGATYVFTGGTGRSGTTILSQILGGADGLHLVPIELRYHVDRSGLTDLAEGQVDVDTFRDRLLGPWFSRRTPMGPRGLTQLVERDALVAAVDTCAEQWRDDPRELAAQIWRHTTRATFGETRIVESTPPTVLAADGLERMLGDDVALVDVVRDGRDVAHSLVRMRWGPDDVVMALHWWANRVRGADKARRHCARPPLVVRFEELADADAHADCAAQLAAHVGDVAPSEILAGFEHFDTRAAHIGSWRRKAGPDHQAAVDRLYTQLWHELADDGVEALPPAPVSTGTTAA